MSRKKTLLISIIILAVGAGVTFIIFRTEPTAQKAGATKETAMLVEVTEAKKGVFQPEIVATGSVEPAQDIILSPRVSGEIIRRSQSFIPGGYVTKGEVLLEIDPSDYQNALQLRKSELQQAVADLNIEMGRQDVARQDYQLIDESLTDENRALVLREPQLKAAQSLVAAAESSVAQAELNLQRTQIKAPFDAHILSRNVNIGSQVSPGESLGRLVGIDEYWVVATVPVSKIRRLSFADGNPEEGSNVIIRNRTAWRAGEHRNGYLYKLIGALEDQTRLARVLISVPDPLGYSAQDADVPQMIIGTFVEARIQGNEIENVVRLNRDYVRSNETVWVMEDTTLIIQDVNIEFQDADYAYITEGLNEGDKIVTTNITTVVDGAPLRTGETDTASMTGSETKTTTYN